MTDLTGIRDALITLLKNSSTLRDVKEWKKAQPPPSTWRGFPFGWIEWAGGPKEPPITQQQVVRDSFYIAVAFKHQNQDRAEDDALACVKKVEDTLASAPTLAGTVATSWVSNREKEKFFMQDEHSVVAIRVTLSTRRRE